MAQTYPDVPVSVTQWRDLVNDYPGLGNVTSFVQNKGPGQLLVFFSPSPSAPNDSSGQVLQYLDMVAGTNAHVYVKALGNAATVACGTADQ